MRLAARMALHAAAWRSTPAPAWLPGARAVVWEHGAMDAPGLAERASSADAVRPVSAATSAPRLHEVEASTGGAKEAEGPSVPAPRLARAVADPETRVDVSRVRGSAWSHGAYRLFVRGRAVRAVAPEIMPCFEPVRARGVAPIAVEARALAPVSVEASCGEGVRAAATNAVEARRFAPVSVEARGGEGVRDAASNTVEARNFAPMQVLAPVSVEASGGEVVPLVARVSVVSERLPVQASVETLHVEPSLVAAEDGIVRRVIEWPLGSGERPAVLGGALTRLDVPGAAAWRALVPQLAGVPMPGEGGSPAVFLDVETTALDRGAGALAFMIGVAAFVGGALRVEQWILGKLSAEPAMLAEVVERVAALAGPGAVLASYNGASFDVPLLRTRLQRARQFSRVEPLRSGLERPHVDLLHPARRMWQGRDRDCRLATLERTRLGVRRVHDIAGHEIPAVFWAWLRRPGDPEVQALMQRAADHNLADLVVLPALGAAIGRCLTAPDDLEAAVRAAQHLVTCGRKGEALALLANWHARPGPAPLRRRALLLAADLLRRDGDAGAPALWTEVCRISPGDPAAHEALAKHLEHRVGDLEQALTVARGSAAPCPRRVARLQRKLGVPPVN